MGWVGAMLTFGVLWMQSSGRPVVYVAEGTHASYFGSDQIPVEHFFDHADGLGGTLLAPDLDELRSGDPGWVGWQGHWGDSGTSPQGRVCLPYAFAAVAGF